MGGPPNICPYVTQGFGALCHRASTPSFCVWGYCHELFKAYCHDGLMDLKSPSIYRILGSDYSPYSSCPKPSPINPLHPYKLKPKPRYTLRAPGFCRFRARRLDCCGQAPGSCPWDGVDVPLWGVYGLGFEV